MKVRPLSFPTPVQAKCSQRVEPDGPLRTYYTPGQYFFVIKEPHHTRWRIGPTSIFYDQYPHEAQMLKQSGLTKAQFRFRREALEALEAFIDGAQL